MAEKTRYQHLEWIFFAFYLFGLLGILKEGRFFSTLQGVLGGGSQIACGFDSSYCCPGQAGPI